MTATAPSSVAALHSEVGGRQLAAWQSLADRLHAVADPTRLRLLAALHASRQQQACVSELTRCTGLPQPTVSRHLQVLHRAALLTRTKSGSRTYYRLATTALTMLAGDLLTPLAQLSADQPPAGTPPRPVSGQACPTRSGQSDPNGSPEAVDTCRVGREARCPSWS